MNHPTGDMHALDQRIADLELKSRLATLRGDFDAAARLDEQLEVMTGDLVDCDYEQNSAVADIGIYLAGQDE